MKNFLKTASLLLCATLLAAVFLVPTSAAGNDLEISYNNAVDGDVLYTVKFGETTGCYVSKTISINSVDGPQKATPTEDGTGVVVSDATADSKRFWYGGKIEGLTVGEGFKYTIEYKIKSDQSVAGTGNLGLFFNTNVEETGYKKSYGSYGNLTNASGPFIGLMCGGSRIAGDFRCTTASYVYLKANPGFTPVADADGFVDMKVEIDGLKYSVYINDHFFDSATMVAADIEEQPYLSIIFYTYNSNGALKDVVVKKGVGLFTPAEITTAPPPTDTEPLVTPAQRPDTSDTNAPTGGDTTTTVNTPTTGAPTAAGTTAATADDGCGSFTPGAAILQIVAIIGSGVCFIVIGKKH